MTLEAETSANERMTSAVTRLDESLTHIRNSYFSLTYTPSFRTANSSGKPSAYEQVSLFNEADLHLGSNTNIAAFAIFFRNSNRIVTSSGNYADDKFFARNHLNEKYSAKFWREEKLAAFAQKYYPSEAFIRSSPLYAPSDNELLPVAYKPYWSNNIMVLLLLDIADLCADADLYLSENFTVFNTDGQLLYSSQIEPALTSLPNRTDAIFQTDTGEYITQRTSKHGDFIYLKQLPKNAVLGQVTSNIYFSLVLAVAALVIGIIIAVVSVLRVLHPVRDILRLFSEENASPSRKTDELHYIHSNVETMLRQREQYVKQITKKDAALSGFLLQSQLKNIYVELDVPEQVSAAQDRIFYILYFRIHYHHGTLDNIANKPSTVNHMMLEIVRQTLTSLFDSALIFQLEPNEFIAKISLPLAFQDIEECLQKLMNQLNNESEFASFTVVQSEAVQADGDFTAVYEQILDAAQYAIVESGTQLLRLPLNKDLCGTFSFPPDKDKQLRALVRDGKPNEAAQLAENILNYNISTKIRRIHMVLLCSSIVAAAQRAVSEFSLGAEITNLGSDSVYNELPNCDSAKDYLALVSGFVKSTAICAASQPAEEDNVLSGVKAFLEKNYSREFSMDELADALHLSKSYLSTYYKTKTGANISDNIQFYRIQKAVELIGNPKLRLGDLGTMVGINNINTFLRQFKKYTGMTPKEYRMRNLQ